MKKLKVILPIVLLIAAYLLPVVSSAQTPVKSKVQYIETTKYAKYAPKGPVTKNTQYRYDAVNQRLLEFVHTGDTINIQLFEYDAAGNLIERTSLSLVKDKKIPDRYNCPDCNFTSTKLAEIKQKIANRLNNKVETN